MDSTSGKALQHSASVLNSFVIFLFVVFTVAVNLQQDCEGNVCVRIVIVKRDEKARHERISAEGLNRTACLSFRRLVSPSVPNVGFLNE
jgi:hypothetical protein